MKSAATPLCLMCGHRANPRIRRLHLAYGVSVWLCRRHRSHRHVSARDGVPFTERLAELWEAADALTVTRRRALARHVERIRSKRTDDRRPGSYSWPLLRTEAERRFAAGHDPTTVIRDLRSRYESNDARPPSVRTMRRWFAEGRWTRPTQVALTKVADAWRLDGPVPTAFLLFPNVVTRHISIRAYDPLKPPRGSP